MGFGPAQAEQCKVIAEELAASPREEEGAVGGLWPDTENCNLSKKCLCKSMFSSFHASGPCSHFSIAAEKLTGKSFSCGNNHHKTRCRVTVEGASFSSQVHRTVGALIVGKWWLHFPKSSKILVHACATLTWMEFFFSQRQCVRFVLKEAAEVSVIETMWWQKEIMQNVMPLYRLQPSPGHWTGVCVGGRAGPPWWGWAVRRSQQDPLAPETCLPQAEWVMSEGPRSQEVPGTPSRYLQHQHLLGPSYSNSIVLACRWLGQRRSEALVASSQLPVRECPPVWSAGGPLPVPVVERARACKAHETHRWVPGMLSLSFTLPWKWQYSLKAGCMKAWLSSSFSFKSFLRMKHWPGFCTSPDPQMHCPVFLFSSLTHGGTRNPKRSSLAPALRM